MVKLYTFFVSHFSEKARWALDHEGIRYEEKVLVPGPHQLLTRRVARRTEVPLLQHEGKYVQGSGAILDHIAAALGGSRLTPMDPVQRAHTLDLEKTLDKVLGRGVQQVLYSVLLKDRATLIPLWSAGGPRWAPAFFALAFPAVASAVQRMYKTADTEGVARTKQRFVTTFDELDALLAKQPYFGGDAPNRIDITVASLLAPVCQPPEHRVKWPPMPAELASVDASLRGRATWNHVLRMYRDHRKPLPGSAAVLAQRRRQS